MIEYTWTSPRADLFMCSTDTWASELRDCALAKQTSTMELRRMWKLLLRATKSVSLKTNDFINDFFINLTYFFIVFDINSTFNVLHEIMSTVL